jgi:hypothetical protein
MQTKWTLIAYESSKPLFVEQRNPDNVYVLTDAGPADKNVVEIYIYDGVLRKSGWDIIRAHVESSRFRDEGYLFYPWKRHEQIKDLLTELLTNTVLEQVESDDAPDLAWQHF